jgi:hypothetical protein
VTNLRFCILASIPLVGILVNTALFIHLGGTAASRLGNLTKRMEARFDALIGKSTDIDIRLGRLEDRMGTR